MSGQLGDKAGPRLASLIGQYVLAARRDHAPIEARVRQVATQQLIDKAGLEVAEHIRPLLTAAAAANPDMHADVAGFLSRTASGRHQLQAIGGFLAMTAGGSALGTLLNNELAPFVYAAVSPNPHLRLEPPIAAAAAAAGILDVPGQYNESAAYGLDSNRSDISRMLAEAPPSVAQLSDLVNRGLIDEATARYWLQRAGINSALHQHLLDTRLALLSPADLALAVLRGEMDPAKGLQLASLSGVTADDFTVLIANTGEPLGLEQLLEARRRGFIDQATFERGFRQSRYRDEWIPTADKLAYSPMTTADAIDAAIQGHLAYDAAKAKAVQNGLEESDFDPLYQTAGEPLARTEVEQLYNRGLMSEADVKQAILESRLKPKYTDLAFALHTRLPEGRQVVSMITHGAVTKAQGLDLLMQLGYTKEIAGFLIAEGVNTRLGAHKDLTLAEIKQLYTDGIFTADHALQLMNGLGYDDTDATFILRSWDLIAAAAVTRQAIGVVRTKYVARHFTEQQAVLYLDSLGVAGTARDRYLTLWGIERQAAIAVLTEAQIVKAHKDGLITGQDAYDRLTGRGYDADDALILLGVAPGSAVPA